VSKLDNDILSFQGMQLLKNLFVIIGRQKEVDIKDEMNVPRNLWQRLFELEMVNVENKEVQDREFKVYYLLEGIQDTFSNDQSAKTAASTTEILLNSALGKVLLGRIHRYNDSGIIMQASAILLKHLKTAHAKKRLELEQNFFLNYTVVLVKHYLLSIDSNSREQKKLSAEVLYYLVMDNHMGLHLLTKMIPRHIIRYLHLKQAGQHDHQRQRHPQVEEPGMVQCHRAPEP
jgi:hypothetical protein